MISGNAEPLFDDESGKSLEAVHVYFPDPWWKKKHRKRRVVNEKSIVNYRRRCESADVCISGPMCWTTSRTLLK